MAKPTVQYSESIFGPIVGLSAIIRISSEHPFLGKAERFNGVVTTSVVQAITEDGFETLNTYYQKEK